jgi:CDP-6-deoxy-D-xylo-4-hexulose-3-dehydrase
MIKLMKNTFYNEIETKNKLCDFILNARQLSMGEKCLEFENKFAKWQGCKYATLFNSGSSANLALITSLKNLEMLKDNDNVGVSAVTWATNVMPIIQNNLIPKVIDIDINTLNISIDELKKQKNLRCLFITNALGFCSNIDEVKKYCDDNNIILLEDNCESMGSVFKNIKLGNFSFASTFSFFVGHHLSTIEGGMVCTNNKELGTMLKMVRAHGWTRNIDEQEKIKLESEYNISNFNSRYTFYNLAYNLRPTEITGFIGCEQLKYIDLIINIRCENFKLMNEVAHKNNKLIHIKTNNDIVSNFAFPLVFKDTKDFEEYKNKFIQAGVEIRPIICGNILEQPFFKKYIRNSNCPNASIIHKQGFYIPNNPELTTEELNKLCELIK